MYWAYDKGDGGYSMLDADGSEKPELVGVLVRPYPERVAGEPIAYAFDAATSTFTFEYTPDPSVTAPTEIVVPARVYPNGYTVECGGCATEKTAGVVRILEPARRRSASARNERDLGGSRLPARGVEREQRERRQQRVRDRHAAATAAGTRARRRARRGLLARRASGSRGRTATSDARGGARAREELARDASARTTAIGYTTSTTNMREVVDREQRVQPPHVAEPADVVDDVRAPPAQLLREVRATACVGTNVRQRAASVIVVR